MSYELLAIAWSILREKTREVSSGKGEKQERVIDDVTYEGE